MNMSKYIKKRSRRRGGLTVASAEAGRLRIPGVTLKQLEEAKGKWQEERAAADSSVAKPGV